MDSLAGLLDGARVREAFLLRAILDAPWSLRIEDQAPLTIFALIRGHAWVIPDNGSPIDVAPGDVVIARGPAPYTVADDPDTPIQVTILPGENCTNAAGEDMTKTMDLGVRTWGDSLDGSHMMVVGTYEKAAEISRRLLDALPPVMVLRSDDWDSPLVPLLASEIVKDEPGQAAVLDRLLDLLLVAVVRAWFARPDGKAPAWYRAQADPVVGRAVRMLQNHPANPWTVASLAAEIGVSRAALARRFTDLVGEPPMTFLTNWRLDLAADLLREPDAKLESVARQVGYGSSFALSTAFKRVRGLSPQQHRLGAGAGRT